MNQQREVIYGYRQEVMDSENPRELVFEVIDEMVPKKVSEYLGQTDSEEPDRQGLLELVKHDVPAWSHSQESGSAIADRRREQQLAPSGDQRRLQSEGSDGTCRSTPRSRALRHLERS